MATVRPQPLLRCCCMDAIPHQRQELFSSGGNKEVKCLPCQVMQIYENHWVGTLWEGARCCVGYLACGGVKVDG